MASRWRAHIEPQLGGVQLARLAARPSLVQQFLAGLARDQLAPNTITGVLETLSSVLGAAVDDGLINRNPCTAPVVRPPRVVRRKIEPWPAQRVTGVRAALPARYQALTDVGSGLGLRQGEAFGLAVADVDFLRRVVHVRRQVRQVGPHAVFAPPKGGKERDVPLPGAVALRLSAHIAACPAREVTLPWLDGDGKNETAGLMFTTPAGRPLTRNTFNTRIWKTALTAAGVRPTREDGFHALRHYFASMLLAGGVDIRALADYLGHTDPGFTLRVYVHLMPAADDRMRAAVDQAMTDTTGTAVTSTGKQS